MLDVCVPWLQRMMEGLGVVRFLLIFDSATSHITTAVKAALSIIGCFLMTVPGGHTMYVQAVDQMLCHYFDSFVTNADQCAQRQRDFF